MFKSDWSAFWSTLRMTGTKKLTKEQFDTVRLLVGSVARQTVSFCNHYAPPVLFAEVRRSTSSLPHFTTIHKRRRPHLYSKLSVRSCSVSTAVSIKTNGAKGEVSDTSGTAWTDERLTLSSEFARADLSTPELFRAMKSCSLSDVVGEQAYCVHTLPLMQGKA